MKFTIFGGSGFIGSRLIHSLRQQGHEVLVPARAATDLPGESWGHVIYAIGLTADFRQRPHDTIEAHVTVLSRLLQQSRFESWLYLSSTRLYGLAHNESVATEDASVMIRPSADSLYDLSKLLGEALCLSHPHEQVRVARLSNVFGVGQSDATFLGSVLRSLQQLGETTIRESPESSKDYVAIDDVLGVLPLIAVAGRQRIYNVAAGHATSHAAIAEKINSILGPRITFAANAKTRIFPPICISRLQAEFPAFRPIRIENQLEQLLNNYGCRQIP